MTFTRLVSLPSCARAVLLLLLLLLQLGCMLISTYGNDADDGWDRQNLPLRMECDECIVNPILLQLGGNEDLSTNIVYHPAVDSPQRISAESCAAIGRSDDLCKQYIMEGLKQYDKSSLLQEHTSKHSKELSSHAIQVIYSRLQTYPWPRRLLTMGASLDDMLMWNDLNRRNAVFHVQRTHPSEPLLDASGQPLQINIATEVENELGYSPMPSYAERNNIDPLKDILGGISNHPWDMVLMYDICRQEDQVSVIPLPEPTDMSAAAQSTRRLCRGAHDFEIMYKDQSAVCTAKLKCAQAYIDFAAERVSDIGYVFILSPDLKNDKVYRYLSFNLLEEMFLHRRVVSTHIADMQTTLVYYTSQEQGQKTVAGRRNAVQSKDRSEEQRLASCISRQLDISSLGEPSREQLTSSSTITNTTYPRKSTSMHVPKPNEHDLMQVNLLRLLHERGYSRVIGILFCCRKRYSEILLPYLQKALLAQGGMIDSYLVFNYGTSDDDPTFPDYLTTLPGFVKTDTSACQANTQSHTGADQSKKSDSGSQDKKFVCSYENLGDIDPKALYIKFDDDILFLSHHAIEHLIWDKLHAPSGSMVHGNGVNHIHSSYIHAQMTAARRALYRERGVNVYNDTCGSGSMDSMRSMGCAPSQAASTDTKMGIKSAKPVYQNPFYVRYIARNSVSTSSSSSSSFSSSLKTPLPARPIDSVEYEYALEYQYFGRYWMSAAAGNSLHYLFLDRMFGTVSEGEEKEKEKEKDGSHNDNDSDGDAVVNSDKLRLHMRMQEQKYWFDTFDMNACRCTRAQSGFGVCSKDGFYRTTINLVAFSWTDIAEHMDLLSIVDEIALTVLIPQRTGIHNFMSGKALYAHAAYTPQRMDVVVKLDEQRILMDYKRLAQAYLV